MSDNNQDSYRFNEFRLDVGERLLVRDNLSVPLTPKVFDVLAVLVERSGHLIEKDEVLRIVWQDAFVEESTVARAVHTLRKVLGEDSEHKFIQTVAKKGYRFIAEVEKVCEAARDSENGKQIPSTVVEKLPETDTQTASPTIAEVSIPNISKPKQTTRVILFTVGFLSVISLISLLAFNRQSASVVSSNQTKSIAVLPLKPVNTNDRDLIYELGIAESLIFKLGSVKGLTIRPLSATRKYSDIEQDALIAGREQQVDYVLASNYQIADGKILVTSQIINVQTGSVESFFKSEKDIANKFSMQDAVVNDIGNPLLVRFGSAEDNLKVKHGTNNEETYRLYLQGINLADNRNLKDARKAVEIFEQAIKLDPNYAFAYVGSAYAHRTISQSGGNPLEERPNSQKHN